MRERNKFHVKRHVKHIILVMSVWMWIALSGCPGLLPESPDMMVILDDGSSDMNGEDMSVATQTQCTLTAQDRITVPEGQDDSIKFEFTCTTDGKPTPVDLVVGESATLKFFATIIGFNNTKSEPEVPITALLKESEASNVASDNPVFVAQVGVHTNVLSGSYKININSDGMDNVMSAPLHVHKDIQDLEMDTSKLGMYKNNSLAHKTYRVLQETGEYYQYWLEYGNDGSVQVTSKVFGTPKSKRKPCIFFYPGSTRIHMRSGSMLANLKNSEERVFIWWGLYSLKSTNKKEFSAFAMPLTGENEESCKPTILDASTFGGANIQDVVDVKLLDGDKIKDGGIPKLAVLHSAQKEGLSSHWAIADFFVGEHRNEVDLRLTLDHIGGVTPEDVRVGKAFVGLHRDLGAKFEQGLMNLPQNVAAWSAKKASNGLELSYIALFAQGKVNLGDVLGSVLVQDVLDASSVHVQVEGLEQGMMLMATRASVAQNPFTAAVEKVRVPQIFYIGIDAKAKTLKLPILLETPAEVPADFGVREGSYSVLSSGSQVRVLGSGWNTSQGGVPIEVRWSKQDIFTVQSKKEDFLLGSLAGVGAFINTSYEAKNKEVVYLGGYNSSFSSMMIPASAPGLCSEDVSCSTTLLSVSGPLGVDVEVDKSGVFSLRRRDGLRKKVAPFAESRTKRRSATCRPSGTAPSVVQMHREGQEPEIILMLDMDIWNEKLERFVRKKALWFTTMDEKSEVEGPAIFDVTFGGALYEGFFDVAVTHLDAHKGLEMPAPMVLFQSLIPTKEKKVGLNAPGYAFLVTKRSWKGLKEGAQKKARLSLELEEGVKVATLEDPYVVNSDSGPVISAATQVKPPSQSSYSHMFWIKPEGKTRAWGGDFSSEKCGDTCLSTAAQKRGKGGEFCGETPHFKPAGGGGEVNISPEKSCNNQVRVLGSGDFLGNGREQILTFEPGLEAERGRFIVYTYEHMYEVFEQDDALEKLLFEMSTADLSHLSLGDVNGDGIDDLVLDTEGGVLFALNNGQGGLLGKDFVRISGLSELQGPTSGGRPGTAGGVIWTHNGKGTKMSASHTSARPELL